MLYPCILDILKGEKVLIGLWGQRHFTYATSYRYMSIIKFKQNYIHIFEGKDSLDILQHSVCKYNDVSYNILFSK